MKDFAILATSIQTRSGAAYAVQSSGTLSERPMITGSLPGAGRGDALIAGLERAIKDLSTYLVRGSVLELRIHGPMSGHAALAAKDSSVAMRSPASVGAVSIASMSRFRDVVAQLRRKGVDIHHVELSDADFAALPTARRLKDSASLATSFGRRAA